MNRFHESMNLRRFHSNCSINKLATKKLLLYEWSQMKSLAYLNLIDYREKIEPPERFPWEDIPYTEEEIWVYCQSNVFSTYEIEIVDKITIANKNMISHLINKLLKVCGLFSSVIRTDRRIYFYYELIYILYQKYFYDPVSFLLLWNTMCGDSEKTKISLLRFFLEKRDDEKAYSLFSYSLSMAQVAHFNFWGMWFKESDEDNLYFCPVTFALLNGTKDYLVLLLKYGFEQNHGRLAIYDKFYYHVENTAYIWLKAPLEDKNPGRNAIVTEIILFLIMISKINSRKKIKSLIKCFRLLWNTNAIPFVTKSELLDEVCCRFQNPPRRSNFLFFPNTYKQFIDLAEYYDQVKPLGCTEDIHPRNLKQITKCAIRKMLVRSYNLPKGIKKLPLPKILQDFLSV